MEVLRRGGIVEGRYCGGAGLWRGRIVERVNCTSSVPSSALSLSLFSNLVLRALLKLLNLRELQCQHLEGQR